MYHHPPLQAENGNTQSINAIKSVNATCAKAVWLLLWPMIPASCNVNAQVGASVKGTGKCGGRGPDFCQTKTKELWDQHSRDNERHERHLKTRRSKVARHQYQPSFFGSYRTLNLKHLKHFIFCKTSELLKFWNDRMAHLHPQIQTISSASMASDTHRCFPWRPVRSTWPSTGLS